MNSELQSLDYESSLRYVIQVSWGVENGIAFLVENLELNWKSITASCFVTPHMTTEVPRGWKQCAELRELHRAEHSLRARLLSIEADTLAVLEVYEAVCKQNKLPIFANARCGMWYVPSSVATGVASFKSCDGHYGKWSLSLRRPNLHVLKSAVEHGGVILVDATRSGKRYPDALSKTVPIWCAVMSLLSGTVSSVDEALHTPPWVSSSERAAIVRLLPQWVDQWRAAGITLPHLYCALRPLWVTTESVLWNDGLPAADQLSFLPVLCMSASAPQGSMRKEVPGREESCVLLETSFPQRPYSYAHLQGGGDDEENWARGLRPSIFWRYRLTILGADDGASGIVRAVDGLVASTHIESSYTPISGNDALVRCSVAVRTVAAGCVYPKAFNAEKQYTRVLVFGVAEAQGDGDGRCTSGNTSNVVYYPLRTHKGKCDPKYGLCRVLGDVLRVLRDTPRGGVCLLVGVGSIGADAAAGVMVAWLAWACDDTALVRRDEQLPREQVTKQRVRTAMLRVLATRPDLSLSRAALLQVNRFFQSPRPPSSVEDVS